jgi:hypothetical protein
MKHFVPHALIALAYLACANRVISEGTFIGVFVGAHLGAPVWSALISTPTARLTAFWRGPGTLIGIHALVLVLWLIAGVGDGPGTAALWVSWAIGLAVYAVYCPYMFALVVYLR